MKHMERVLAVLGRSWKAIAGVVGLGVLMAWSGGACQPKVAPGKLEAEAGVAVPAGAAVVELTAERAAVRVELTGTVAPRRRVQVSPLVGAHVREVHIRTGEAVKAGQLLVTLDERDAAQQVAAAEAQLTQAEREHARVKALLEKEAATRQALEAAEAALAGARAQAERARVLLGYARLTAPMDGVVSERRVEPGDFAAPGQPLVTVYDPADLRLEVPVPVRLADRLPAGTPVQVEVDSRASGPGTLLLDGEVAEAVAEVDAASRTQTVKIALRGVPAGVLPGAFGRIRVAGDDRDVVTVPAGAVYREGQLEVVQLVRGSRALRRLVRTAPAGDGRLEVLSGLSAGDRILAQPHPEQ